MPGPINLQGQIPTSYVPGIISGATQSSAVLTLGRRVPIPTGVSQMTVAGRKPKAAFVSVRGGRKPYTDADLKNVTITAEEIAAVVSVPDSYLDDASINLWQYLQPLLGEAIGEAIDEAVMDGTGAPDTYPTGGILADAIAATPGIDALDTVNNAMIEIEDQGLEVTGHAGDSRIQGVFRGVRDNTGALLLGQTEINGRRVDSMWGRPITWTGLGDTADFITGDWQSLVVGVRQDIRFKFSQEGVIADDQGKVIVSAYQDNQTLLKVWARIGVILAPPPTRYVDEPIPFAYAKLRTRGGAGGGGGGTLAVDAAAVPDAAATDTPSGSGSGTGTSTPAATTRRR